MTAEKETIHISTVGRHRSAFSRWLVEKFLPVSRRDIGPPCRRDGVDETLLLVVRLSSMR